MAVAKQEMVDGMRANTVLLLGNYRATIAVAEALSEAGHRVIAGLEGEPLGIESSRYVDEFWDHPELQKDETRFLDALNALLERRQDIGAVLPVSEEFVLFLAAHEHEVKRHALLASPQQDIIQKFSDKPGTLQLAGSLGVPTLPFACVTDFASLERKARAIGFPLTIRGLGPTARVAGCKALILESLGELHTALPSWPSEHTALLVQRYARGRRHNVYFAACLGQIIGLTQSRILRTNSPDGTGLAVDGITETPDTQLVGDTRKLVEATAYSGIGLAQFIVDPDTGERCFLELNPRVSGSHQVAERSGLPLSRMAIELSGNDPVHADKWNAEPAITGKNGLRYAWTDGDLLAAKQALIRKDITVMEALHWLLRTAQTTIKADFNMVWNWRNPGPALMSLLIIAPFCRPVRAVVRKIFTAGRLVSYTRPVGNEHDLPDSPNPRPNQLSFGKVRSVS